MEGKEGTLSIQWSGLQNVLLYHLNGNVMILKSFFCICPLFLFNIRFSRLLDLTDFIFKHYIAKPRKLWFTSSHDIQVFAQKVGPDTHLYCILNGDVCVFFLPKNHSDGEHLTCASPFVGEYSLSGLWSQEPARPGQREKRGGGRQARGSGRWTMAGGTS